MTDTTPFKLGTFTAAGGRPFAGLVIGERAIAIEALRFYFDRKGFSRTGLPLGRCETMLDVLNDWQCNFAALQRAATLLASGEATELVQLLTPLEQLRVLAPVPQPGTIYCSGANYKKHVVDLILAHHEQTETQGMGVDDKRAWGMKAMDERARTGTPFIFLKPQSTVTGPFDPVIVPYDATKPDWELELGVVIGRHARRVSKEQALDYVAGYTVVNDITIREKVFRRKSDAPELGMDFTLAKGAPTFLPMGPYLVPAAFIADPQKLRLTLKLNGETMQDEATSDMIFPVARLIEYVSQGVELQPGDVICTGSPAGNGMHYNRFIRDGDTLEGSITEIGTQRNSCVAESRPHG